MAGALRGALLDGLPPAWVAECRCANVIRDADKK
jgi:hypothetical protein